MGETRDTRPLRVLLVDDHPLFTEALRTLLVDDARLEVVATAKTGREALRLAKSAVVDVVLMDMSMPVLDGLAATRRLRALDPAPRVIAVSGHTDDLSRAAALEAGAAAFLSKADARENLGDTIVRVWRAGRVGSVQRLYQREGAGRPPRVRWALEETGTPYEWVVMTPEEGRLEEHARRHPLGRVPVLETADGLLFESAALCLHVADSHPERELIPAPGSFARGQVYQWAFFAMTELEPRLIGAYMARRGGDPGAAAKADQRLEKAWRALAAALVEGAYLVGGEFTIADVIVGGVLENARKFDLLPDDDHVLAYLARLDERPAKQRAYA